MSDVIGVQDSDTADQSLDDGDSLTLSVSTKYADTVRLFIDDGTTDGTPASYDLTTRVKAPELGDVWMFYAAESGVQYRSVEDPATDPEMQYEITNTSGNNSEQYRARLVSVGRN